MIGDRGDLDGSDPIWRKARQYVCSCAPLLYVSVSASPPPLKVVFKVNPLGPD